MRLRHPQTNAERTLPVDGVFVFIGLEPRVELVRDQLALDERGHIVVDTAMRASLPGVYAIGDVRRGAARQIITAMADGVIAALDAEHALSQAVAREVAT